MRTLRGFIVGIALVGLVGLSGCEYEEGEGPAERAGKEVDDTVKKAGEKVEEAGKKMQGEEP